MKLKLIDLLIYLLLFIFIVSLPVDLLNLPIDYELDILIGVRAALLIFFIYIIWKNKIKVFEKPLFKEILLFLPFFLICFNNFIASFINGGFEPLSDGYILFLEIFLCLISAVLEEIIFRLFIQNFLENKTPLARILLSAAIFALFHFINAVNVRSVVAFINVLFQVVYTFGLGLAIAFIYEYSRSFITVVLMHFFFNLFNDVLYGFLQGFSSNLVFIFTSVIMALLAVSYGVVLYLTKFKKLDNKEQVQ